MRPILSTKHRLLTSAMAAIFFGFASLAPAVSAEENTSAGAAIQTSGNLSYVSGGVGTVSLDQLTSISSQFNLKLVFALKSGSYLSDVHVVIADAQGTSVLDTISEGPWFMAKLPKGKYQVIATLADKSEKRQVNVDGTKLRTIDFRWDAE